MNHIHFYINKEDDILAVSFDNEVAVVFFLSYRDFADNPTYEAALAWFSSSVCFDSDTSTQEALYSRYITQPLSMLGHLVEL